MAKKVVLNAEDVGEGIFNIYSDDKTLDIEVWSAIDFVPEKYEYKKERVCNRRQTSCSTCERLKFPKYEPFKHMGEQLHGKCMQGVCNTAVLFTDMAGVKQTVCLIDGATLDSFYCAYYERKEDE